ncbi:MAG: glutamate racemase [Paludibacteraceae bacterium]|nr:glutamate racemase [Paludibacteraceae bacterium]
MKIGVFDSGYGGLTILQGIRKRMPDYDFIYLGDNARTPYGTRSFEVIYQYTLQAVRFLQSQGCRLIIIACNTASAKALRTIQQKDINPDEVRVLGVIRPTVEKVAQLSRNNHIGILATPGTVSSGSYVIELQKQFAALNRPIRISQQACPMWVPLIEAGEQDSPGADYFIGRYLDLLLLQDPLIDTIILGCTHYPIVLNAILRHLDGRDINIIAQGDIVALALVDYLKRHPEIDKACSRGASCTYLTTESPEKFVDSARIFIKEAVKAQKIELF